MSAAGLWKLPAIATFIFLAVFGWALWRALRPSARREYDRAAQMALDGERQASGTKVDGGAGQGAGQVGVAATTGGAS